MENVQLNKPSWLSFEQKKGATKSTAGVGIVGTVIGLVIVVYAIGETMPGAFSSLTNWTDGSSIGFLSVLPIAIAAVVVLVIMKHYRVF